MTSPFNTSKHPNSEWLFGGNPGAIEQQEVEGQREMLRATTLPADMRDREAFEALGFEFGEIVKDDPMFIKAKLPEGWEKQATNHSMWTEIVDERKIRRVGIFYKAAFYDRSAHMSLVNVGREVASHYIYGDDDVVVPDFSNLTKSELAQARDEVVAYEKNIEEYPDIYGKHQSRVAELRKVLFK